MSKVIIAVLLVSLISACGNPKSESTNESRAKESCPLIQEAWTTYLERDLDENNLDILAASWYFIKQDLEKVAEIDNQYQEYVNGVDDALNGNYTSQQLIDLLAFCDIATQE